MTSCCILMDGDGETLQGEAGQAPMMEMSSSLLWSSLCASPGEDSRLEDSSISSSSSPPTTWISVTSGCFDGASYEGSGDGSGEKW